MTEYEEFQPQLNPQVVEMLENWIYVAHYEEFFQSSNPKGSRLKDKAFNLTYSHLINLMPKDEKGKNISPASFLKYTHRATNLTSTFNSKPNQPPIYVEGKAKVKTLNGWVETSTQPIKGDIEKFEEYVLFLMDEDEDQAKFFMQWLAHIVRYPDKKIRFMPIISSNTKGLGKNFFINHIVKPLVGENNCEDLHDKHFTDNFDEWKVGTVFATIDELQNTTKKFVNALKDLITNDDTRVNPKGVTSHKVKNFTNFIAFSNHKHSMLIDEGERRYFIVHNTQPRKPKKFFDDMELWLSEKGGIEAIYYHLLNDIDLSDFDRDKAPLLTHDFDSAVESSKSDLSTYIRDCVEDGVGLFNKKFLFTKPQLNKLLREDKTFDRGQLTAPNKEQAYQENGLDNIGKVRLGDHDSKILYTFGDSRQHAITLSEYQHESGIKNGALVWYERNVFDGKNFPKDVAKVGCFEDAY